jgi:hypothetical protein
MLRRTGTRPRRQPVRGGKALAYLNRTLTVGFPGKPS